MVQSVRLGCSVFSMMKMMDLVTLLMILLILVITWRIVWRKLLGIDNEMNNMMKRVRISFIKI